jgi:hypothetical protein
MGQKTSRSTGDAAVAADTLPSSGLHRDADYLRQYDNVINCIKSGNIDGITKGIYWKKPKDRADDIRLWGKFWDATALSQWIDLVDLGVIIFSSVSAFVLFLSASLHF